MLTVNQRIMISELLCSENVEECVEQLLRMYAKSSYGAAKHLLGQCHELSNIAFDHLMRDRDETESAARWAIRLRSFGDDPKTRFAAMVPVCMVLYPAGTAKRCCKGEQDFFAEFVSLLKNPKVFDWGVDGDWADDYGYTDFLKRVFAQEEQHG